MRTWIKFCGTTCLEDALASIDAGADALGFIFAPSKRQITVAQAKEISGKLPPQIERIGVFVDLPLREINKIVCEVNLSGIQLHGGQDRIEDYDSVLPEWTRSLRVIRSVVVSDGLAGQLGVMDQVEGPVSAWLIDSGAGSGKTFHWKTVRKQLGDRQGRFIIAGGLNPDNVGEAIEIFSPWGVDLVTGIESTPGRKDPEKMKAFVTAVRKAEKQ